MLFSPDVNQSGYRQSKGSTRPSPAPRDLNGRSPPSLSVFKALPIDQWEEHSPGVLRLIWIVSHSETMPCIRVLQGAWSREMLMKSSVPAMFLSLFAFCGSRASFAATPTASFSVTATVQASCQARTTLGVPPGNSHAGANTVFTVRVLCNNSTPVSFGLNAETERGSTADPRSVFGTGMANPNHPAPPESRPTGIGSPTMTRKEGVCVIDDSTPSLSAHDQLWESSCVADGLFIERFSVVY